MYIIEIRESFKIEGITKIVQDFVYSNNYSFDGETHNFWEVVYVDSGKVEIVENDEIYILGRGDMIFHAPMEFHRIKATENTTPHVYNISFIVSGTLPPNIKDGVFKLDEEQRMEFLSLFDFIKYEFLKKAEKELYVGQVAAYKTAVFLINISNSLKATENISTIPSAITYKNIVKIMNDEVCNGLFLEDIAKRCFISVSYIKSLFKKYAGISPKSYYDNLRIEEAKRQLSEEFSVADVADKMNFSSPNHFIRFFKNIVGITPFQYKKNILNKNEI